LASASPPAAASSPSSSFSSAVAVGASEDVVVAGVSLRPSAPEVFFAAAWAFFLAYFISMMNGLMIAWR
jgi:hypothetical protein